MVNEYDVRVDRPDYFYGNYKKKKKNYYLEISIVLLMIMAIFTLFKLI